MDLKACLLVGGLGNDRWQQWAHGNSVHMFIELVIETEEQGTDDTRTAWCCLYQTLDFEDSKNPQPATM
jgi:hypothetical protein